MKNLLLFALFASAVWGVEIQISGDSAIFNEFKKEARNYDTSVPAEDYAYLNELLPKTIIKMLAIDDAEGLALLNKVARINDVQDAVGGTPNFGQIAKEKGAKKCVKTLEKLGYRFN